MNDNKELLKSIRELTKALKENTKELREYNTPDYIGEDSNYIPDGTVEKPYVWNDSVTPYIKYTDKSNRWKVGNGYVELSNGSTVLLRKDPNKYDL